MFRSVLTRRFWPLHCFAPSLTPIKRIGRQTRSCPTYEWQDNVENLEYYRKGGFHPIKLNDSLLDGRYSIVHKLGYGSFSTVWLAKDHGKNRYVR